MAGAPYPAIIHVNKTLAIFFRRILELFQIFKKQNVCEPNFATSNFVYHFFLVRLVRGVQIFEPLGKKLLGTHAFGGDFGGLSLDFGFRILNQRKEKSTLPAGG